MKKKIAVLLAALCMMTLCVVGCGNNSSSGTKVETKTGATTYPLKITDGFGHEVTIESEPKCVVSLAPSATEIIYGIKAEDKLVARTDECNYPDAAKAKPSVGPYYEVGAEKIVSFKPDLVIVFDAMDENVQKQVEATGAKVVCYKSNTLDQVMMNMVSIGEVLNKNDNTKALVEDLRKQRETIKTACAKVEQSKNVFVDLGEYFSAGPGSLIDSMLTEINAKNIAGDADTMWPVISQETIVAKNPDVYISLFTPAADIKKVSAFKDLNAVKNDQVICHELGSVDADVLQRPGTRIIDGLKILAKDIYPEIKFN